MTIARGGVITGVVRDVRGRPVPGVSVRVLRLGFNALTGERTLGAPARQLGITDDRGEYRAYGLPPGGYLVLVRAARRVAAEAWMTFAQLTSAELQQAIQAAGAGARTRRSPGHRRCRRHRVRVNYAPVFHPGATDIGAAATITLGLSEERTGVDSRFSSCRRRRSRAVTDPSGGFRTSLR